MRIQKARATGLFVLFSYYSQIKTTYKREAKKGAGGLNRGTRIVAPQVSLLAIPDAPPGFCAHWARPSPIPRLEVWGMKSPPSFPYRKAMKGKAARERSVP